MSIENYFSDELNNWLNNNKSDTKDSSKYDKKDKLEKKIILKGNIIGTDYGIPSFPFEISNYKSVVDLVYSYVERKIPFYINHKKNFRDLSEKALENEIKNPKRLIIYDGKNYPILLDPTKTSYSIEGIVLIDVNNMVMHYIYDKLDYKIDERNNLSRAGNIFYTNKGFYNILKEFLDQCFIIYLSEYKEINDNRSKKISKRPKALCEITFNELLELGRKKNRI